MTIPTRLARASRIMAWLSSAGAILYPVAIALCFFFPDQTVGLGLEIDHLGVPLRGAIPASDRILALFVELVPVGLVTWALVSLARLFRWFSEGEVFSMASLKALGRVTQALFFSVVAACILEAPVSYLLTRAGAAGHREITFSFGSGDIEILFLAGTALVIARAMSEARRIALENESFV